MELVHGCIPISEEESTVSLRRAFLSSFALHVMAGGWLLHRALNATNPIPLLPLQVRLAPVPEPITAAPRTPVAQQSVEHRQPAAPHHDAMRKVEPQLTRQADQDTSAPSFNVPEPTKSASVTPSSTAESSASAPQFNAAYLNNPAPDYPAVARRRRLQGTTFLEVRVSASGRPVSIEIGRSSGVPDLDEAARAAVRGWTFLPAKLGDKPVEGRVEVPIRFRLND